MVSGFIISDYQIPNINYKICTFSANPVLPDKDVVYNFEYLFYHENGLEDIYGFREEEI